MSSWRRRRLAAIMIADVACYTVLGQRNESLSLSLLEDQRKLTRSSLNRHNGREVKIIGDAFLIEFPSAPGMRVKRAYTIFQRTARELNLSLTEDRRVRPQIRINTHTHADAKPKRNSFRKVFSPSAIIAVLAAFGRRYCNLL